MALILLTIKDKVHEIDVPDSMSADVGDVVKETAQAILGDDAKDDINVIIVF